MAPSCIKMRMYGSAAPSASMGTPASPRITDQKATSALSKGPCGTWWRPLARRSVKASAEVAGGGVGGGGASGAGAGRSIPPMLKSCRIPFELPMERSELMDVMERMEQMEPIERAEFSEATLAKDPDEKTLPRLAVLPTEPTEECDPTDATENSEPAEPAAAVDPSDPREYAEPRVVAACSTEGALTERTS